MSKMLVFRMLVATLVVLAACGLLCPAFGICQEEGSPAEMALKAWEMLAKKDYDGVMTLPISQTSSL